MKVELMNSKSRIYRITLSIKEQEILDSISPIYGEDGEDKIKHLLVDCIAIEMNRNKLTPSVGYTGRYEARRYC